MERRATRGIATALGLLWLSLAAGPAAGELDAELGVVGGFVRLDEDVAGNGNESLEPLLGLAGGFALFERWGGFFDVMVSEFDTETFRGDADSLTARASVEFWWNRQRDPQWFVSGGVGFMELDFERATSFSSAFASVGIGQRVHLLGRKHIRWELRADHTLARDGLTGADVTQAQFLVGLTWGREPVIPDSDDDGVTDRRDRCPRTPAGREVDDDGCPVGATPAERPTAPAAPAAPRDADRDGVSDDLDRCPHTLEGIEVDAAGCPRDDDGDGVHDGLGMDKCPGTPAGARVDPHGCPLDDDGDGVYDGLDRCPRTPRGTPVDATGCPAG